MSDKTISITLTEDEYKTMITALHGYGDSSLEASIYWSQKRVADGVDYVEGARLAKVCGDRAFKLKQRIADLWERHAELETK